MKRYDVIVIGAGPAGSMAAKTLATEGVHTLLIERKRVPGTPKECAEGIGKKTFELLEMEVKKEWISNPYDSILAGQVDGGKGLFKTQRTQGYILDRKKFDYDLAMTAHQSGADILFGTPVLKVSVNGFVLVTTPKGDYQSSLVIAADGPKSKVAQGFGLGQLQCEVAIQYELEGGHELAHTLQILFYPEIGIDTFCWIFPKKNSLNVGITSKSPDRLRERLDRFVRAAHLSERRILEVNAGLIPGQNKLKRIFADRTLVVGDAAGHTNPLTGGGIPVALYDGMLAGKIAAQGIKTGKYDSKFLSQYETTWKQSPFHKAWRTGFTIKKMFEAELSSKTLQNVLAKVNFETITTRKGMIKKFLNKGFSIRENRMLFRIATTAFDHIIDYAM